MRTRTSFADALEVSAVTAGSQEAGRENRVRRASAGNCCTATNSVKPIVRVADRTIVCGNQRFMSPDYALLPEGFMKALADPAHGLQRSPAGLREQAVTELLDRARVLRIERPWR